jgi:hypothetical protein
MPPHGARHRHTRGIDTHDPIAASRVAGCCRPRACLRARYCNTRDTGTLRRAFVRPAHVGDWGDRTFLASRNVIQIDVAQTRETGDQTRLYRYLVSRPSVRALLRSNCVWRSTFDKHERAVVPELDVGKPSGGDRVVDAAVGGSGERRERRACACARPVCNTHEA